MLKHWVWRNHVGWLSSIFWHLSQMSWSVRTIHGQTKTGVNFLGEHYGSSLTESQFAIKYLPMRFLDWEKVNTICFSWSTKLITNWYLWPFQYQRNCLYSHILASSSSLFGAQQPNLGFFQLQRSLVKLTTVLDLYSMLFKFMF